ncbi:MAG: hypothetical protein WCX31_14340 [Salinivirgaceae bacterium]|jgi:hypothetical protein
MKFNSDTAKIAGANSSRKGVKNRSSEEIKQAYSDILNKNIGNLETWLKETAEQNPAKALELFLKLSEFILPRMRSTDLTDNTNPDLFRPVIINLGSGIKPNADEN